MRHATAGWADFVRASFVFKFLSSLCVILPALGLQGTSVAGSFSVNPTRVELSKSVPSAIIEVRNASSTDTTVQLHGVLWSQEGGEDQIKATRDIIATPQIFNLRAGGRQIIRVGFLKKPDASLESSYRLILEEIPPPPDPEFRGLQVALKISLPVFVKPESAASADLKIGLDDHRSTEQGKQGEIRLNLHNQGLAHAQLLSLKIFGADSSKALIANYEKSTYLLPGQRKTLGISTKMPIPEEGLLIKVQTYSGMMEFHAKPGAP